jgi:signal transduction histidine kinase
MSEVSSVPGSRDGDPVGHVADRRPEAGTDRRRQVRGGRRATDRMGDDSAAMPARLTAQLATISHELRTPLNAIVGWVQVLRRNRDDGTVERVLAAIERSTKLQGRLLEDLLDLGRLEVGQVRLDLAPTVLNDVVRLVVEMLGPAADARQLDVQCDLDPALPAIMADTMRIQQVLWNVMVNAIKFSPVGGAIRIRSSASPDAVRVTIQDTGGGIPDDVMPLLFEPFQQGHNGRQYRSGVGLGLAVAQRIVHMHDGTIAAQNAPGNTGSVFTLILPVSAVQAG